MTAKEFIDRHQNIEGTVIAALTDEYIVDTWPKMEHASIEGKEEKILELRIFNENEEHKLFRTDIGRAFTARMIGDRDGKPLLKVNGEERDSACNWETLDEEQFLDIDTAASAALPAGEVQATGGGRYHLPFERIGDAKIKIRYYIDRYPETGQAFVADWRVVELMEGR